MAGTYTFGYQSTGVNLIGTAGGPGFGVGVCPANILPAGMTPMAGYDNPMSDNYGNYQYPDGSICCWVPRFYYKFTVNDVDVKGIDTYPSRLMAEADGYAIHRAFIDGGIEQQGFFDDKYKASKNAWGSGWIASSIKNGLPLSTHADHNPIADLTACDTNAYFEAIKAAKARDGVDGAENATSKWFAGSQFIRSALAIISLAHAQASTSPTYCAWYDPTYNYPKGCNNNVRKDVDEVTNGAGYGAQLTYTSDGYLYCGKTGSGVPFAKSTHNGQACGIADVNGLMWEIALGVTSVAPAAAAIESMSQASPCVVGWTGHGMDTDDWVMILAITQADWIDAKDKLWQITKINDDTFSIAFDASGFGTVYDAGTDPGTMTKATGWYAAKEATAMKDFTSGDAGATDHWGEMGVAAMMDQIPMASMPFKSGGALAQYYGSGANQVLSEATSGTGWILTGLGLPKDSNGIDSTGTDQFGKDYFYQSVQNGLCIRSGGGWNNNANTGVWHVVWSGTRINANTIVGFRLALYPE